VAPVVLGLVLLIVGIAILTVAADHFVEGAAAIATARQISPVVVGALIIGFGTSLPEMLVSGVAAAQGDPELGVGNVVGSNVANLSLVLGFAALIAVISCSATTIRRELPMSVASVVLFAVLVQNGFTRIEGFILLAAMVAVLANLLSHSHDGIADLDEFHDEPVGKSAVRTVLGLAGTVGGAWLLVEGALGVADSLGLSGGFVGLTMVAIGTSLPELVTAVVAARKGETGLIIGNLLGSNIFNSLAVGAVLGLVGPGPLDDDKLTGIATYIMLGVVVLAALFLLTGGKVVRWQAAVLLMAYFAAMPFTASTESDCDSLSKVDTSSECIEAVASTGD